MSDLMERVARAIFEAERDFEVVEPHQPLPERHFKVAKALYLAKARAAIAAMREPTDAMVDDAEDAWMWRYGPRNIWRAMIDEALR